MDDVDAGIPLPELMARLARRWHLIVGGSVVAGAAALAVAFILSPVFTAKTVLLPPQQQQSAAASALGSLGALAGLAGGALSMKSPAEQYVSFMQSAPLLDPMIDQFKLMAVYKADFRVDARQELIGNSTITIGKKDGLITVEVDDRDPKRAADLANAYVEGLRRMTNTLAVSEAQQRRVFFEQKLAETKNRLTQAQVALQGSGFNPGAIKAEPKAAAEGFARLRAETTAAEIKLQSMRRVLADNAPEIQQQQAVVQALRGELAAIERRGDSPGSNGSADYVSKYREYKYQETLFELFARQYELARADESREGALIQVVEPATPPEKKSKPRRALIALGAAVLTGLVLSVLVLFGRLGGKAPTEGEGRRPVAS